MATWNPGAQQILGHAESEVIGQHLSRFYRPEAISTGEPERALATAEESGRYVEEGWRVRRDGFVIWANVVIQPVSREGRVEAFGVLLRDDTERKHVQDETTLARQLAVAIAGSSSIEDALALVLRQICETAGWQIGEAWVRDGEELECSTAWYAASDELDRFRRDSVGFRIRPGTGLPGIAWATGKPVFMKDIVSDPRFLRFALARKLGIGAGMAVPISSGEVVAVLVFFVFEARDEDEELVGLVSGIEAQLGALIARRRAEDVLQESEARYRLLAENSTDIISVTRADGVLTYVSPASRAVLGWKPEEVVGRTAFEFVHPDDVERVAPTFQVVLEKPGMVTTPPYRVRRADGSYVWIESTVRQVRDPRTGEIVELQATGRDVSERRMAEEALRQSDLLKTTLLRSVSHDFRSPLTAIIAAAEASASPTISEEGRTELNSVIVSQATRLSRLVDKLLDLSRLQAGHASPRRIWCSIEELLDSALEHVAGDVGHFHVSIEEGLPSVLVDPAQLERALANLFDNARRYGGGTPVEVNARAAPESVVLTVTDRGPGIQAQERERVFEPFYRGDGPAAKGSGLGLAIVKGFVELNGGRVSVEDPPDGTGSTFVVELPVEAEWEERERLAR